MECGKDRCELSQCTFSRGALRQGRTSFDDFSQVLEQQTMTRTECSPFSKPSCTSFLKTWMIRFWTKYTFYSCCILSVLQTVTMRPLPASFSQYRWYIASMAGTEAPKYPLTCCCCTQTRLPGYRFSCQMVACLLDLEKPP